MVTMAMVWEYHHIVRAIVGFWVPLGTIVHWCTRYRALVHQQLCNMPERCIAAANVTQCTSVCCIAVMVLPVYTVPPVSHAILLQNFVPVALNVLLCTTIVCSAYCIRSTLSQHLELWHNMYEECTRSIKCRLAPICPCAAAANCLGASKRSGFWFLIFVRMISMTMVMMIKIS